MDKSSLMGVALAIGGILLGLMLEGGRITQIIQPTAAMIVFGGTLGAVMLAVSLARHPGRSSAVSVRPLSTTPPQPRGPLDPGNHHLRSQSPQRRHRFPR